LDLLGPRENLLFFQKEVLLPKRDCSIDGELRFHRKREFLLLKKEALLSAKPFELLETGIAQAELQNEEFLLLAEAAVPIGLLPRGEEASSEPADPEFGAPEVTGDQDQAALGALFLKEGEKRFPRAAGRFPVIAAFLAFPHPIGIRVMVRLRVAPLEFEEELREGRGVGKRKGLRFEAGAKQALLPLPFA